MILYDRLKEKYTRAELISLLGNASAGRIWREEINLHPTTISKKIDIKQLDYSFEDFFEDYDFLYKDHLEKYMIYNLFIEGVSVASLIKQYNLESLLYVFLKKGFNYNSTSNNLHLIFSFLGICIDTSSFTIDFYKRHVELFGTKEDIKAFKERYDIKYDLYYEPYRKSWHLAFDGCLAEHIRKKSRK